MTDFETKNIISILKNDIDLNYSASAARFFFVAVSCLCAFSERISVVSVRDSGNQPYTILVAWRQHLCHLLYSYSLEHYRFGPVACYPTVSFAF